MRIYNSPTFELLTDIEDIAWYDLLLGNAEPLDFIPCFSSYIDCI